MLACQRTYPPGRPKVKWQTKCKGQRPKFIEFVGFVGFVEFVATETVRD